MRYFIIETLGDDQDPKLAFIDTPPEDLGLYEYCIARGERIGDRYPAESRIYLKKKSPGIKLSPLLGTTRRYLVVNTAMKNVTLEHCAQCDIETLPFVLYNHKRRVHSTDYWIINPIGYVDCVNRAASDIRYLSSDPTKVVAVRKFVLDPKRLENGPDIFRVPEDRGKYFISQATGKGWQEDNFSNVFLIEVEQREAG